MLRTGVLFLVLSASTASAANPKFAVVDVEAAMNATDHWKKIKDTLTKSRQAKQAELEAKQKELRGRKEQLDAQKAVSDPKTVAPQEEKLNKDAQELMQGFMKTQQDMTAREKKLTDAMLGRIEVIVRDIALADEIDFVFEAGSSDTPNVLYADKTLHITQRVVAEYNKRFKDKPIE
jgi:outer membrane protein